MKNVRNILLVLSLIGMIGCKYDDEFLDAKLPKTIAYFASEQNYSRTVIVGEGLQFRIGAAMAGVLSNKKNQTVDFQIGKILNKTSPTDTRILLPANYYNSGELGNNIKAVIPAGEFLGYFTVKLDSVAFLNDPISVYKDPINSTVGYTIPVKIIGTSLDSIANGLDSIKVSVRYMADVDGYYLFQSVIQKEVAGSIIASKTKTDNYANESDNSAWRLLTIGPFKVKATSAVAAFTSGLSFNLTVQNNTVLYESITGQPLVTGEGANSYDPKTRDFTLNYNYKKASVPDTTYHVSSKLIFRNRMVDKVNETRDYLKYLNK